jgi:hypothetical protein
VKIQFGDGVICGKSRESRKAAFVRGAHAIGGTPIAGLMGL